jgi:hypothetical protein
VSGVRYVINNLRVRQEGTTGATGAVRLAWGKAVWRVAEHEDNA